jgi:hypothetical protein
MGIPEIQLPLVRSIRTEEELDRAVEALSPPELKVHKTPE